MSRLLMLTGPSCVGKSPLLAALRKLHPELAAQLQPLVLYNDREPRPGEQDGVTYHFRPREAIEALKGQPGYIVLPVRRDVQALEMAQVRAILDAGHDPFFEGNVYIAAALLRAPELADVPKTSCFLSPLSLDEAQFLRRQPQVSLEKLVCDVMRRKLLRRDLKQKGTLGEPDLRNIEARCGAAFAELQYAPLFDWVLPNHDGEGSENWDASYYPLGDARRCLLDLAAILQGKGPEPCWAERWPAELFA
jgi:guanylate kinase